jgi:very-short-patch-repair endonuclease
MSNIQGEVLEHKALNQEIKKQLGVLRTLRKNISDTESRIDEYLESKDLPGVKYKGYAVMRNPNPKRRIKKKKEQLTDSISVLEKYDIHNPQDVLKEIMEARKGSPTRNSKLISKKYKQNS